MLRLLPDLVLPVTPSQVNPLMENLVQLNILEAGLNDRYQRALSILFHTYDTFVKTHGRVDYLGLEGRKRMMQDAMAFCGHGNPVATRHGDLAAAHLAIDYHDTQERLRAAGIAPLPAVVSDLISMCMDLTTFSSQDEIRANLLLDYMGKRPLTH